MKYSNDCKKTGMATEGYTNTIGYPSMGNKAPAMKDNSILTGIADAGADMITPTPAKKNHDHVGVNLGMFNGINFDGKY